MNMTERRRDEPASRAEPPIGFETFHQKTRASFRPRPTPDREPDFVSPGRSVYWDLGDRVVRASDHWSGQNGCEEIGGCLWAYEGACRPGVWEVGDCAYGDFRRRIRVCEKREASPEEIALARLIRSAGGGVDPALWLRAGVALPVWARVAPRGTLAAEPAEEALRADPGLARVLTADASIISLILSAGEVRLPSRMT
jgi:hypothetical protein